MKNAETPAVKVVLYGAMSSLGSALMAELLRRQHEVIAILDDLTALAPRPGLRTKTGDLFDLERDNQSVAGSSAVICLLDAPGLPFSSDHVERSVVLGPVEQVLAVDALVDGLQAANVSRLFLVGDFAVLDEPDVDDRLQGEFARALHRCPPSRHRPQRQLRPGVLQGHAGQVQALVGGAVVDHLRGFYMGDRIGNDADQLCLATDVHGKPQR